METFDVIVIGTGTAGQTAAFDLAADGYRVAIAENSPAPGGVCALKGCQAKKWFYEAMEISARSRHLMGKGITDPPRFSWEQVQKEKPGLPQKFPKIPSQASKALISIICRGRRNFWMAIPCTLTTAIIRAGM